MILSFKNIFITAAKLKFRLAMYLSLKFKMSAVKCSRLWRYVVNSFRFAIRRTVRIAFRAFFVVQGRAEGGVSTGIYPERRSRFTEWPVVCEESRRSPDLCAQRSDAFVPSRRFSRYVRAYSMHNGRRADLRGENRDRKEIGSETRKEWQWWKRKGGLRGRHVWMYEHAAIYDRRIADRVAFKIDPVFQRLANEREIAPDHVRLPLPWRLIVDSRLFARASRRS